MQVTDGMLCLTRCSGKSGIVFESQYADGRPDINSIDESLRQVTPAVSRCTEASMCVGRTMRCPLALTMARWPGRLYRNSSLPPRVTTSCTYWHFQANLACEAVYL